MNEIVLSVSHVTTIMEEITAASAEQQTGIEHIHLALGQMDDITQQNAALVEEAAAAAESMREQTLKLSEAVAVFKFANDGRKGVEISEAQAVHKNVKPLPKRGLRVAHNESRERLPEQRQWAVLAVANGHR
jgi:hypothetical protein